MRTQFVSSPDVSESCFLAEVSSNNPPRGEPGQILTYTWTMNLKSGGTTLVDGIMRLSPHRENALAMFSRSLSSQ